MSATLIADFTRCLDIMAGVALQCRLVSPSPVAFAHRVAHGGDHGSHQARMAEIEGSAP